MIAALHAYYLMSMRSMLSNDVTQAGIIPSLHIRDHGFDNWQDYCSAGDLTSVRGGQTACS